MLEHIVNFVDYIRGTQKYQVTITWYNGDQTIECFKHYKEALDYWDYMMTLDPMYKSMTMARVFKSGVHFILLSIKW